MVESSNEPLSSKPRSRISRFCVWTLLVIGTVILQIRSPWLFAHFSNEWIAGSQDAQRSALSRFWNPRFSFTSIRNPLLRDGPATTIASATVWKNQLIVLLQRQHPQARAVSPVPMELVRVQMTTGRMTISAAPENVHYVLSDGERIWWLPEEGPMTGAPFLLNGRPVAMKHIPTRFLMSRSAALRVELGRSITRPVNFWVQGHFHQMMEYVEDHWRPTNSFAFAPSQWLDFSFDEKSESIFCGFRTQQYTNEIWYRSGVDIGTQEEIQAVTGDYFSVNTPDYEKLGELGWRNIYRPQYPYPLIGSWSDDDRISELRYSPGEWQTTQGGFMWSSFDSSGPLETEYVALPVRWNHLDFESRFFRIVRCVDDRTFIVFCDGSDGHWQILQWDNGQLKLILHRNRKLILQICLEAAILFVVAVLAPTLLFALVSQSFQRSRAQHVFSTGHESVVLATVMWRGLARAIDLSLLIPLAVLSVICHPDFVGWWREVVQSGNIAVAHMSNLTKRPDWNLFVVFFRACHGLFDQVTTVPTLRWLFMFAAGIAVAQLIWQARRGLTVGKWMCGLKVVRTTLRPCGLSRSLLRELLLVIDSCLLLSWVPGVISILTTKDSQRIGDRLADTIVITLSNPTAP